jgi:hypothetical protein
MTKFNMGVAVPMSAVALSVVGSLVLGAASAHAAPTDDYINAVHTDGIKSSESDSDLLIAGRGICQMLDNGATRSEVFRTVYEATKLPGDLSRTFINDAVQYLCPWNG